MEKNLEEQNEVLENSGNKVLYGGFWARLAAHFIDSLIVGVVYFIVMVLLGVLSVFYIGIYGNETVEMFIGLFNFIFSIMFGVGYYVYMTYKYQATLGKMAIGIRVLNEKGKKPTLGEVFLREFVGKIVSAFTLGIGYLMAAFTNRNQALHDMIGKTIVVCKDQKNGTNKIVVILVNVCVIGFYVLMSFLFIFFIIMMIASESGTW
ncbi:MAG: RDD family protein [Candidatus Moranbacteria bacterium]|nr:RDD family protein [Candidatus Moranbacteria bacterium]